MSLLLRAMMMKGCRDLCTCFLLMIILLLLKSSTRRCFRAGTTLTLTLLRIDKRANQHEITTKVLPRRI